MRRAFPTLVLVATTTLVLATGCANYRADALLEEARPSFAKDDCDAAWPFLEKIGRMYPDSASSSEAFLMATYCFAKAYNFNRFIHPDSVWVTEKPGLMFDWVAHFFGNDFPQRHVQALLNGLNYSFGQKFVAYCAGRPDLAMWEIHLEKDDGLIQRVSARRISAVAANSPQRAAH